MNNISEHITYREATYSHTAIQNGIDNTPDEVQLEKIKIWAEKVFEPLRAGLGGYPIYIEILFRCAKLNAITPNASSTSDHQAINGAAGDIDNDNYPDVPTNRDIFFYILKHLEFDQLIWEHGSDESPAWVHVGYREGHNRKQVLRAIYSKELKKTIYKPFNL